MENDFTYNRKRSKLQTVAGFMKTFLGLSKEEFGDMDHKLIRIGVSVTAFVAMALFWMFFLRNIIPFRF